MIEAANNPTVAPLAQATAPKSEQVRSALSSSSGVRTRSFVESLGSYDRVVTYEEIESLDGQEPAVLVDYAHIEQLSKVILNRFHITF